VIDASTVKRAVQVGKYLIEHARAAFDEMCCALMRRAATSAQTSIRCSSCSRIGGSSTLHPP
jgi:hypothetical protein